MGSQLGIEAAVAANGASPEANGSAEAGAARTTRVFIRELADGQQVRLQETTNRTEPDAR